MQLSSLEKSLVEQVKRLGLMIYAQMVVERNLFGFSETIVNEGYFKQLFSLPPETKIPANKYPGWTDKVQQLLKNAGLWPIDQAKVKQQIAEFVFKLDQAEIPFKSFSQVNQKLIKTGSKLRICAGYLGTTKSCIIGLVNETKIDQHQVIRFTQELARTPNAPLTIAAMTVGQTVFLREEAVRFIFTEKWAKAVKSKPKTSLNDAEQLANKLRKKTLQAFGIKDASSLAKNRTMMLEYVYKSLTLHELGHHQLPDLDQETLAIADASAVLGHNFLTNALEWLSDFNPAAKATNPIRNILKQKGLEAIRYLYLLISDNYYYDSEDKLLSFITDLTLLVLVAAQDKDKIKVQALKKTVAELSKKLLERVKALTVEVKNVVSESKFKVAGKDLDFKNLYLFTLGQVKEKNPEAQQENINQTLWTNIFKYVKDYNPGLFFELKRLLREAETEFLAERFSSFGLMKTTDKAPAAQLREKLIKAC